MICKVSMDERNHAYQEGLIEERQDWINSQADEDDALSKVCLVELNDEIWNSEDSELIELVRCSLHYLSRPPRYYDGLSSFCREASSLHGSVYSHCDEMATVIDALEFALSDEYRQIDPATQAVITRLEQGILKYARENLDLSEMIESEMERREQQRKQKMFRRTRHHA